jgi:hypothetical protein
MFNKKEQARLRQRKAAADKGERRAKALNLAVPPSILLPADEAIERVGTNRIECPLRVMGCRDDYVGMTAGVPQKAADLQHAQVGGSGQDRLSTAPF